MAVLAGELRGLLAGEPAAILQFRLVAADIEGEIFFRPGCFANVNPIYDPAFANSHGAYRSELCRPLDGLAVRILEYYEYVEPGDPLLLLTFDADSTALRQAAAQTTTAP